MEFLGGLLLLCWLSTWVTLLLPSGPFCLSSKDFFKCPEETFYYSGRKVKIFASFPVVTLFQLRRSFPHAISIPVKAIINLKSTYGLQLMEIYIKYRADITRKIYHVYIIIFFRRSCLFHRCFVNICHFEFLWICFIYISSVPFFLEFLVTVQDTR